MKLHGRRLSLMSLAAAAIGLSANMAFAESKTKNIILVIGDGMGPQQVGLLQTYSDLAPKSVLKGKGTVFERMIKGGQMNMSMTHPDKAIVVDSAASASQLATGQMSGAEMIGLNAKGYSARTVLEVAKQKGMSVGLVSDTRITHATPGSFAAHVAHRSLENKIAEQMLASDADVLLSGGLRYWIPKSASDKTSEAHKALTAKTDGKVRIKSKRKDERNLITEAEGAGYETVFTKEQLSNSKGNKVLGLFSYSGMYDGITNSKLKGDDQRAQPTLEEMAKHAISVLEKNENGFFLMVEAGQIDWAGHYNDTGSMLHEMLKMNDAVTSILDWADTRNDTLVLVTADHETGGFGFSYSAVDLPDPQELPGDAFEGRDYKPNFNFISPNVLDKIYNQKISHADLFYSEFDGLDKAQQTPENLAKLVAENSDFEISAAQAKKILDTQPNPYYVRDHKYLSSKTVPKLEGYGAFFVYQTDDNRQNLLARELAEQQGVVWSTGSHTSTPVFLFAQGEDEAVAPFTSKLLHHTDIGRFMIDIIE
ncbi:alkaline phosphatase [Vibrio penaeicida]|nr:alkaline phosphatase [Vibrio penaeicida]RTZ21774.1 alkaline phosphatase [Vibrio penaeicida]